MHRVPMVAVSVVASVALMPTAATSESPVPEGTAPRAVLQGEAAFEEQRVASQSDPHVIWVNNFGLTPLRIEDVLLVGDAPRDFFAVTDCAGSTLLHLARCRIDLTFAPASPG